MSQALKVDLASTEKSRGLLVRLAQALTKRRPAPPSPAAQALEVIWPAKRPN